MKLKDKMLPELDFSDLSNNRFRMLALRVANEAALRGIGPSGMPSSARGKYKTIEGELLGVTIERELTTHHHQPEMRKALRLPKSRSAFISQCDEGARMLEAFANKTRRGDELNQRERVLFYRVVVMLACRMLSGQRNTVNDWGVRYNTVSWTVSKNFGDVVSRLPLMNASSRGHDIFEFMLTAAGRKTDDIPKMKLGTRCVLEKEDMELLKKQLNGAMLAPDDVDPETGLAKLDDEDGGRDWRKIAGLPSWMSPHEFQMRVHRAVTQEENND